MHTKQSAAALRRSLYVLIRMQKTQTYTHTQKGPQRCVPTCTRADAFKKAPCSENRKIEHRKMKNLRSSADAHPLTVEACCLPSVHYSCALTPNPTTGHLGARRASWSVRGFTLVSGNCPGAFTQTHSCSPLAAISLDQTLRPCSWLTPPF